LRLHVAHEPHQPAAGGRDRHRHRRNQRAMSFSPNPSTVPPGQVVVWHNRDSTTHRIVLDDGRFDAGTVAPGAFTGGMTLNNPGPYHCTIHPEMVGRTIAP